MKASPRFFLGVLDRKSPPAVCRGGGRSAAPCCSSSSSSRTGCAKAASASPPNHLARVRCSHGARARKVLTSCAHSGVRRKFFERLRWGPRTRTHHLLLRRHGLCEALRCACRQTALRARAASGCSCASQLTDVCCSLAAQEWSMVRSRARARLPATSADRREALGELLPMGTMRAGALVALRARSFRCMRDTRASLCGKKCALRRCRVRVCTMPMVCRRCILICLNGVDYRCICVIA